MLSSLITFEIFSLLSSCFTSSYIVCTVSSIHWYAHILWPGSNPFLKSVPCSLPVLVNSPLVFFSLIACVFTVVLFRMMLYSIFIIFNLLIQTLFLYMDIHFRLFHSYSYSPALCAFYIFLRSCTFISYVPALLVDPCIHSFLACASVSGIEFLLCLLALSSYILNHFIRCLSIEIPFPWHYT